MIRNLTALVVMIYFTLGIAEGAVLCKKDGRYWRPANDKAVKIAEMLGVKTCNGKRFKQVVAKLGESSNVKKSVKKMEVDDVVQALK